MRRKRDENEEAPIEDRAHKRMLELNQEGKLSDFQIIVWGEPFYVNKIVLSAISPYFAKKFEAEWECASSVDLKGKHSVEAFSSMIEYIYTYSYEQRTLVDIEDPFELVEFYFELYRMTEEYEIPGLKEQVLEDLPSAVKTLACPWDLHDMVNLRYISDSESGKVFVAAVADNFQDMRAFEDLDRVKQYLVETPVFAANLISELIRRKILNGEGGN